MAQLISLDRVAPPAARRDVPLYVPLGIIQPVNPLHEIGHIVVFVPGLGERPTVRAVSVDQRAESFLGERDFDFAPAAILRKLPPSVVVASFERWNSRPPPSHYLRFSKVG